MGNVDGKSQEVLSNTVNQERSNTVNISREHSRTVDNVQRCLVTLQDMNLCTCIGCRIEKQNQARRAAINAKLKSTENICPLTKQPTETCSCTRCFRNKLMFQNPTAQTSTVTKLPNTPVTCDPTNLHVAPTIPGTLGERDAVEVSSPQKNAPESTENKSFTPEQTETAIPEGKEQFPFVNTAQDLKENPPNITKLPAHINMVPFDASSADVQQNRNTEPSVQKITNEVRNEVAQTKSDNLLGCRSICAPDWMHKYILERDEIKKMNSKEFSKNVVVYSYGIYINVEGDENDINTVTKIIETLLLEMKTQYTIIEMDVDVKYYKFIIGTDGANIRKIRDESDADVYIPDKKCKNEKIKIMGIIENVHNARQAIEKIVAKYSECSYKDIHIDSIYHKYLIGNKGCEVKRLSKLTGASIHFSKDKSDKVYISGTAKAIEDAETALEDSVKKLKSQLGIEDPKAETASATCDHMEEMNDILIQQLKCFICSTAMLPPIYMCLENHNICSDCKSDCEKCLCDQAIEQRRNYGLENLANKVPYTCKYKELGCSHISARIELINHEKTCNCIPKKICQYKSEGCPFTGSQSEVDNHECDCIFNLKNPCIYAGNGCLVVNNPVRLKNHEKNCAFLPRPCPLQHVAKCLWCGCYQDLKKHIEESHGGFSNCGVQEMAVEKDLKILSLLLMAHNEIFFASIHNGHENGPLECFVRHMNPGCTLRMFKFQLDFIDQTNKNMKFLIEQICDPFNKVKNVNSLLIPKHLLKHYMNAQKSIYFKLNIIKL